MCKPLTTKTTKKEQDSNSISPIARYVKGVPHVSLFFFVPFVRFVV